MLDNKTVVDKLLEPYLKENVTTEFDYRQFREEQFDKLAEHVRRHANIERVIGMME
jgi:adenosylcobyric acid synthase